MAVFVNPRDQLLQATVPRVVPLPIDPNTIPGLPGAIAATKGVRLIAPSTVFQVAANGTPSPASITLTALLTNVSGPIDWSIQSGTATLTGTGNSRTLAAANMATSSVTIRASVSFEGSDYISDYTIAKVVDGANGAGGTPGTNTALVYAYMRSATAPTTNPGAVTWTFNVAAITTPTTLPNGWSKAIPAGTDPIYVTVATASSSTATDNIAANEWTTPVILGGQGAAGANGLNVARPRIYQRAASSPTLPSVTTTFTFSTGVLTGLNNGWTTTIPAGTAPLYISEATATSNTNTDTLLPAEWSSSVILVQNGADGSSGTNGINSATVFLYRRSAAATLPAAPTTALTYTFATGVLSGTLSGWTQTVPDSAGGRYLFVTTAAALSNTATDSIAAGEWSAVRVLAESGVDGSPGNNGLNATTVWLFTRSSSTTSPATPAGNLVYNFTTGLLTGTLGIWSQSVPLVAGTYLHVTTATAASTTNTTTILPAAWAAGRILAKDGDTGATGDRGSLDLIGTLANLTAYPARPGGLTKWSNGTPSTANATAADNAARDVVWVALGNSGSAINNSHLRAGDMITLKNTAETVVVTGYWGGSSWLHPGQILDGNLLVPGTVTAAKIDSRGLTIRMADGTIVLDASRRLNRSDLTDLGVLAALNSVALGSSQVTGNLPNTQITGLGALAVLNSVNLNTQTTGALNGLTQVTNLGGLAYANAVAANQIGAGVINAGHISAGAITTPALAAGVVTADKLQVGSSVNLLSDSKLITAAGWEFNPVYAGTSGGVNIHGTPWKPVGENVLGIDDTNASGGAANWSFWSSTYIPCQGGLTYGFSVLSGAHRANVQAYLDYYSVNASGAVVAWVGSTSAISNNQEASGGTLLTGYKQLFAFAAAPATAGAMRLILRKSQTITGANSAAMFTRPMVFLGNPGQTVPPPWMPSGVGTLITPAGISTPNLSSLSAVIGLLRTSASGQRSELDDNGHRVYDVNNVLRVRTGIW